MSFHSCDQDLLLLAHQALPFWPNLKVQVHVVFCARCRTRLAQFEEVSAQTAAGLRGPELPVWTLPYPSGTLPAARIAVAWLSAFTILLALLILIAVHLMQNTPRQSQPIMQGGCRPDLPNDQCR